MDDLQICQQLIRQKFPDAIGIWLFGSAAVAMETASSDIDLAFLSSEAKDPILVWECAQEIADRIDKEVDLVELVSASTVMRAEVVKTGRLIYCGDHYRCALFDTEALTDYLRFSEERGELIKDIKRRGSIFS